MKKLLFLLVGISILAVNVQGENNLFLQSISSGSVLDLKCEDCLKLNPSGRCAIVDKYTRKWVGEMICDVTEKPEVKKVEKPKDYKAAFKKASDRVIDKMAKEAEFEKLLNEVELELEDHCWHPDKYDGPIPAYCFKIASDSIVTQLQINRAKIREEASLLSPLSDNNRTKAQKYLNLWRDKKINLDELVNLIEGLR